ncbi:MAG: type II toxin-antitoxin system PemK/MazF family toxin [Candidatus Woesearchaeota archaeon]
MSVGTIVSQRDIVLIPFPFSDLPQNKKRPAIIISCDNYNRNNVDVICCAITSNLKDYRQSVEIGYNDFESGHLDYASLIKPAKVFSLQQNRIIKKLARLNVRKSKEVINRLSETIKINE